MHKLPITIKIPLFAQESGDPGLKFSGVEKYNLNPCRLRAVYQIRYNRIRLEPVGIFQLIGL